MVLIPQGPDLTLADLRAMAARQQQQIEVHQQLLVAKEQRLKFLKQQEARHHQGMQTSEGEKLRYLREKVEAQESKLRRLRGLRGQADHQRANNNNLSAELESIRALFNEKEKELSLAVAKVENLTRQLEDLRGGNVNTTPSAASVELDKLKRELLFRTKINEQQNARIAQQRETLSKRQGAVSQMDQRIAELQQRLHRKRLLNQQLSSQLYSATVAKHAHIRSTSQKSRFRTPTPNIAAVEPLKRVIPEPDQTQDDIKISKDKEDEFIPNKNDPKYQTLPYNTKFLGRGGQDLNKQNQDLKNGGRDNQNGDKVDNSNSHHSQNSAPGSRNHQPTKPSPPHGLGHLAPRPFGTTYNSSLLGPLAAVHSRGQHLSGKGNTPTTVQSGPVTTSPVNVPTSRTSVQSHQITLPPTVMTATRMEPNDRVSPLCVNAHTPPITTSRAGPQPPARQHPTPHTYISHRTALKSDHDIHRPVVPPKPTTPQKPIPPPRQTHIIGQSTTESVRGDNIRNSNGFRYVVPGPPAYIRSAHNRKGPPPYRDPTNSDCTTNISSHSQSPGEHSGLEHQIPHTKSEPDSKKLEENVNMGSTGIHITLNKRIEMPPAFLFPEQNIGPTDVTSDGSTKGSTANCDRSNDRTKRHQYTDLQNNSNIGDGFTNAHDISVDSNTDNSMSTDSTDKSSSNESASSQSVHSHSASHRRVKKGNLKTKGTTKSQRRVSFDPLALLLDAALEGELELVKKTAKEVTNPSAANDEGITALHNAICAGHLEIVKFLVEFGCDVNAQDSDGWTPLHCAASCNNLPMVKFLVENGACVFATTLSDHETAAEKCEEEEEGFDGCSEYLYSTQEKLGILNNGAVYAVYDYESQNPDELSFKDGQKLLVLRKGDDMEREWWWSRLNDREGYVPRNLLGLYPRISAKKEI